jgi:hypothetical protein
MNRFPRLLSGLSALLFGGGGRKCNRRDERRGRFFRPLGEGLEKRYVLDGGTLSIGDIQVNEEQGTASFPVTFQGSLPGGFSVDWSTADGSAHEDQGYSGDSGSLTFSGSNETQLVHISLIDDYVVEATKDFHVNLGAITGDPNGSVTISDGSGKCDILNTDATLVRILALQTQSAEGGASSTHTTTFQVTIDDPVEGVVNVDWATVGVSATEDDDFVGASGTAVITGLTGDTFTVTVTGDAVVELDEVFGAELSNVNAGSLTSFVTIAYPTVYHTIIDDDQAQVNLLPVESGYGEGAGTIIIGVQLVGKVDYPVYVDILSSAGTAGAPDDYAAVVEGVTFDAYPGTPNASQSKYIEVQIVNDNVVEALSETFNLWITNVNANGRDVVISGLAGSRMLTIVDNDQAQLSINDVSVTEGSHGQFYTELVFTVTLSKPVNTSVSFSYYTAEGSADAGNDYVPIGTRTITLPPHATSTTITVNVVADYDGDDGTYETFEVWLTGLSASGRDVIYGDQIGEGTIIDDDP